MIIEDFEQLSEEWYSARAGLPTASNFDKIITTKGAPSKSAQKYLYGLAAENITGVKAPTYQNAAMLWGIEHEPQARADYEWENGVVVKQTGLVYPDAQKKYGCSPDGLMEKRGLEIKCPYESHVHVDYVFRGKLPTAYFQQVHGSMLVTGFESWVFKSYYPGLPRFELEIERDETFIKALEEELDKFVFELAKVTKKLREME